MAGALVGGAFLSASLQVLFERLASREVLDIIRTQKLSDKLLNKLERKLLIVGGVLNDAEVKQFTDPAVKKWLVHVKDAVYDAEDLLDEIATEALRCKMEAADRRSQTGSSSLWNSLSSWVNDSFASQGVESRVEEMIAKLQDIADEIGKLGLKKGDGEKLPQRSPSTSLVDESCDVYGRDEIKEEMIKQLLSDNVGDNKMDVISIVGMGGSGKTTLAQLLYNDARVKEHFPLKAWVCVSEGFLLLRVTKIILEEIGSSTATSDNLNLLQLKLKESLRDKKFLLVLDDVWDKGCSEWSNLRVPLQAAGQGSKVVVTTRSENVAKTVMPTVHTCHLEELSPPHSWSLFANLAFGNGDSSAYPELESIGEKIVGKCKGLPLAVKALGSLLRSKAKKKEWDDVLNSELWELPTDPPVLPSLLLSYHNLPLHLKRCFAYCSIFPKDHEFVEEELILLWMAEGLLQPCSSKRMEEVGALYFHELVAKSFFQKSITAESCFVMHDLIHDLAQHISEEFCVLLEEDKVKNEIHEKTRHLLHFKYGDSYIIFKRFEALSKVKHLRTFLELPNSEYSDHTVRKKVLHDILSQFRCLRVLTLCDYRSMIDLPDSIGNLKHLRYLDLSKTWIKELPESVCNLYNLQTMILSSCEHLIRMPSRIGKLINLRHLDISDTGVKEMPTNIGQLKNLQALSNFVVGKKSGAGIEELRELSEIRGTLIISKMQNVACDEQALRAKMKDKKYLDELVLEWHCKSGGRSDVVQASIADSILNKLEPDVNLRALNIEGYEGSRFPNWIGDPSFSNLVSMTLVDCNQCSALPPLGQLSCLQYLHISGMKAVKQVGSEFYGNGFSLVKPCFPSLQTLKFWNMDNWEEWLCCGSRRGEFPRLQVLRMENCGKLSGKLPKQLPTLKTLKIVECPKLLVASLAVPAISKLRMRNYGELQLEKPVGGFNDLRTSEIEISSLAQWNHLPVVLEMLSITKCESVEGILQAYDRLIQKLRIQDCCFSRAMQNIGLPFTLQSLELSRCTSVAFLLPWSLRRQPPFLERLRIDGGTCGDSSLSFTSFHRLNDLEIVRLEGLEDLSALTSEGEADTTSLHRLNIRRCPSLVYVDLAARECYISKCLKLKLLKLTNSSMESLCLKDCPHLMFQMDGLPSNLQQLEIIRCSQLTPQVDWGLQRMDSLTQFIINGGCEDMESFPQEFLLPSTIRDLGIFNLPNLKYLDSNGLEHLTSLEFLSIQDCPDLQSLTVSSLQQLTSLQCLKIWHCPRLQSLSGSGLRHLSSLKVLEIHDCPELQSLTEVSLQHPSSLEKFEIDNCPKLQCLTKQRLPDSVSRLVIEECPLLEKRCQFRKGQDWGYIAHVPHIVINDELLVPHQ